MERPSDLNKVSAEPELYLKQVKAPFIFDEAQRLPELFPILRSEVDERKSFGQFVLLGSSSFQLIESISESLSGRVGFLDLGPLSLFELEKESDFNGHWLKGGFPDVYLRGPNNELNFNWFEDYTRTLIERDLPGLGIQITPAQFRKLWAMCAHFHGEILNMNKMANSLDLSPNTVKRYLDILEQTFMIHRVQPLMANLKKRMVKSPKLYIRDSGMFHYFLRVLNQNDLINHPSRGESFEGYVIEQILRLKSLLTPEYEHFYFRTSDQIEVDLVLKKGNQLVPIEVKMSLSPTQKQTKSLHKFIELTDCQKGFVLTPGADRYPLSKKVEVIGVQYWQKNNFSCFWQN